VDIAQRIEQIVKLRHEALPSVQNKQAFWTQIGSKVDEVEKALSILREHPRVPVELRESLPSTSRTQELKRDILRAIELHQILNVRFARNSVNIGVSGEARVGKSTLLQAISGLGEEQIPTGSNMPVTAVRSRIFHSATHERATLIFHSYDSFREEVLSPHYKELELGEPPFTLEEFRRFSCPRSVAELPNGVGENREGLLAPMLRRLQEIHSSLSSYEKDLTGGRKEISLAKLRPYVAYPTAEEESAAQTPCPRPYLAVRDIKIECSFPKTQVEHLGIVDLPGLGEIAANIENYHIKGLENEVDLVFLVLRPREEEAFFGQSSHDVLRLLHQNKGFTPHPKDFIFILINSGNINRENVQILKNDVQRRLNGDQKDKNHYVIEADASSPEDVARDVLGRALAHLADRIPAMDRDALEATTQSCGRFARKVEDWLKDIDESVKLLSRSTGDASSILDSYTDELPGRIARNLSGLLEKYREDIDAVREGKNSDFVKAVNKAYEDVASWIEGGFDQGQDEWRERASVSMSHHLSTAPYLTEELNKIRVEISKKFSGIDNFCTNIVNELWDGVVVSIRRELGDLFGDRNGKEALEYFRDLLGETKNPCISLQNAVQDLLDLRIEYRSHLHPQIREQLDRLNFEIHDENSGQRRLPVVRPTPEGVEYLYRETITLAEEAAYRTRRALLEEKLVPARIIFAWTEQFIDAFTRSRNSLPELRHLARSYRDEIWPNVFQNIDGDNARVARVSKLSSDLRQNLHALHES